MEDERYCPGCGEGVRGELLQLDNIIKQAQAYAKEKKIPVAIYKEGGEYKFCEAFTAYQNHYPVTRVVSEYNNAPAV
jgi:hypothetical protein